MCWQAVWEASLRKDSRGQPGSQLMMPALLNCPTLSPMDRCELGEGRPHVSRRKRRQHLAAQWFSSMPVCVNGVVTKAENCTLYHSLCKCMRRLQLLSFTADMVLWQVSPKLLTFAHLFLENIFTEYLCVPNTCCRCLRPTVRCPCFHGCVGTSEGHRHMSTHSMPSTL